MIKRCVLADTYQRPWRGLLKRAMMLFFPLFVVKEEISEVKLIIFISLNISMMGKISVRA